MMRISRFGLSAVACLSAAAGADVVTDWNEVCLETIRAEGGPPCPISRMTAMVHAAMYDAVNSVDRTHQPYLTSVEVPSSTSREAAAAAAAHRVLVHLYPGRSAIYDAALADSLLPIPDGADKTRGIALGVEVADALIDARSDDGTQMEPPYVFGGEPGDYRPTYPDFTAPPFNPGWGSSAPWTMIDGRQFRPDGPAGFSEMTALLQSAEYAQELNEVKEIGALDSATRTPEQTLIGFFWANDVNGTSKPPGHLNSITRAVSEDLGLSLSANARLFAIINLALADAGLVAWDTKYNTDIDLWRPITAIRLADTDGNPATIADPDWEPLNPFSPPFPSWVSGHATFAAAHAAAMAYFFGTDEVSFTVASEDPFYRDLGGGPRSYDRFSDAADENAESRLYLGVHFRIDATAGNEAGTRLGRYVAANMLLPVCRADFDGSGALDFFDFLEFQNRIATGDLRTDLNADGAMDHVDFVAFMQEFAAGCP